MLVDIVTISQGLPFDFVTITAFYNLKTEIEGLIEATESASLENFKELQTLLIAILPDYEELIDLLESTIEAIQTELGLEVTVASELN